MNILVFSDSHRSLSGMCAAMEAHQPHQAIHLGDLERDAAAMSQRYPHVPFCTVPGNCDGWTKAPLIKEIRLAGKSVLLSHGHVWGVKSGVQAAIAAARAAGADILLFGHTHRPLCQQLEDGLWVMNPGSSRSSYGLIQIANGQICCSVRPIP